MISFGGRCARGGRVLLAAMLVVFEASAAHAQTPKVPGVTPAEGTTPPVANPDIASVPGFWDPRRRPERPDLSRISIIRFLTETDYPPFDYAGPDGAPAGFNVDLARLICEEIKVACTVQMRRFDTLVGALRRLRYALDHGKLRRSEHRRRQ